MAVLDSCWRPHSSGMKLIEEEELFPHCSLLLDWVHGWLLEHKIILCVCLSVCLCVCVFGCSGLRRRRLRIWTPFFAYKTISTLCNTSRTLFFVATTNMAATDQNGRQNAHFRLYLLYFLNFFGNFLKLRSYRCYNNIGIRKE